MRPNNNTAPSSINIRTPPKRRWRRSDWRPWSRCGCRTGISFTMLKKFLIKLLPQLVLFAALFCLCNFALAQTRPATQATTVVTHPPDITFLQLLVKGGWIMVPIGLMSMIGLGLILERTVALRRSNIIPRRFLRDLKKIAPEGVENREAAMRYCREHPSPIARIVAA